MVRDNIDTDQIISAQYLNLVPTIPEEYDKLGSYALCGLPREPYPARFVPDQRTKTPYAIVIGGRNFGCGSSREQAVTCLKYKGVGAVVAGSFARIFYRNAINQGVAAIMCPEAVAAARPGDPVQVDLVNGLIHLPAGDFAFPAFPPNVRAILEAGGLVAYTKKARSV